MSKGSYVVDDLRVHKERCKDCKLVTSITTQKQPVGLCLVGQTLYARWYQWAKGPDEE